MHVDRLARKPAPTVPVGATVREAVEVMAEQNTGALVVLDGSSPAGIVSERDIVLRAVREGLDPSTTPVERIMSAPVETVNCKTEPGKAIEVMAGRRFRHLAVVDDAGKLVGLLSSRDTFQEHLSYLFDQLLSLESFVCADGPGG